MTAQRNDAVVKRNILVIDDSQTLRSLFYHILTLEGYTVHLSPRAYEHAEEVERLHPQLIILDFQLGKEQTGFQQFQRLKCYPPTATIPLLICTAALKEITEYLLCFQQANVPIILKPFKVTLLLQIIHQLLCE